MIQIGRTSFKKVDGHDEVITENVVQVIEKLSDKFSSTIIKLRSERLDQLKNILENPTYNPVDILFKDLNLEEFQQFHHEFKEDIFEKINPVNVVKSRNSIGGTGFDQVKLEVNEWKKKLLI